VTRKLDEEFKEAEKYWDLERLYKDLATVKGKPLTRVEKLHLRGLLCGYSPAEIAEKRHKETRSVEANLCSNLYQYVKKIVNREKERIESWRSIRQWLEEKGYQALEISGQTEDDKPFEAKIHIENVNIEEHKIGINLQIALNINTLLVSSPLTTDSEEDT
jgi:hypothetical protein